MNKLNQIEELALGMAEDSRDIRENSFYNEQQDKKRLIEYSILEEQRLLSNLPGTPPMTFCLGSSIEVKYLNDEISPFVATIVPEDIVPMFEWQHDYEQRYTDYLNEWNKKRANDSSIGALKGTPISVHSPLVMAIYGKTSGEYRVVVDGSVYNVEVSFC